MSSNATTVERFVEVVRSIRGASRSIDRSPRTSEAVIETAQGLPIISGEQEDYSHGDLGQWERKLDAAVRSQGTDALAYYVSFHDIERYSKRNWGIFIKESGIRYLAAKFQASFPMEGTRVEGRSSSSSVAFAMSWSDAVFQAYQALLFHELFHFTTDCMVTRWESLLRAPCWAVHHDKVQSESPNYDPLEEALANAYMYKQCGKNHVRGLRRWLKSLIANSPQGYNEGLNYISEASSAPGLDELSHHYIEKPMVSAGLQVGGCLVELHRLYDFDVDRSLSLCPVHLVRDAIDFRMEPLGVSFITNLGYVVETSRFQRLLKKCPRPIQEDWRKFLSICGVRIPRPPKFAKFKDVYSLRLGGVNGGYRAHLKPIGGGFTKWEALEIGTHLALGHGK